MLGPIGEYNHLILKGIWFVSAAITRYLGALISGRTIKRELEHSVELRPTRPVRLKIDYFKCVISEEILWNYAAKTDKNIRTFV